MDKEIDAFRRQEERREGKALVASRSRTLVENSLSSTTMVSVV